MKTAYTNLSEISELQTAIMRYVAHWARTEKTPIPLRQVIREMENQSINDFTTIKALEVLLKKGYIRRSVMISNKTSFVQLRSVI